MSVTATTADNETKTRRYYEELWNKRNLDVIEDWVTPDFIGHHTAYAEPLLGIEGFRAFVTDLLTAFPDLRMTVHDTLASGDKVASRITMRGTHKGDLQGYAPTGLVVEVEFIGIERYVEGRCAEEWVNSDDIAVARQIKALPPQGSGAERLGMLLHRLRARRLLRKSGL